MEARKTFAETSVPKGLVVLAAVGATIGLAVAGALATKHQGASDTGVKSTVQAPATLPLRQDNDYPVIVGHAATNRAAATHKGRMGGPIDSSDGFNSDEHGADSDLTRALPGSAPVALPLWVRNEMNAGQTSDANIVIDQGYIDQYLTSNPGWDARSVREGHGQ